MASSFLLLHPTYHAKKITNRNQYMQRVTVFWGRRGRFCYCFGETKQIYWSQTKSQPSTKTKNQFPSLPQATYFSLL